LDRPAGAGVDRRGPRRAADQGPDPAADQLGRIERADDLRGDRPARARELRSEPRRERDAADRDRAPDGRGAPMSAAVARADGPVLVMAGGTGGHIFPGLAVADELRARHVPVIWLGADDGLETRLVPQHGVPLQTLPISGVRGKGVLALLAAPLRVARAVAA